MSGLSVQQAKDVAVLLREAARAEILPRFRRLPAGTVRTKSGPLDLVTEADEAAERRIASGLVRLFPGATVVGRRPPPPIRGCSNGWPVPIWPSWSILWTARRISPAGYRCSAAWRRRCDGGDDRCLDPRPAGR